MSLRCPSWPRFDLVGGFSGFRPLRVSYGKGFRALLNITKLAQLNEEKFGKKVSNLNLSLICWLYWLSGGNGRITRRLFILVCWLTKPYCIENYIKTRKLTRNCFNPCLSVKNAICKEKSMKFEKEKKSGFCSNDGSWENVVKTKPKMKSCSEFCLF